MKNYIYPAALALMLLSAASCNKIQVTEPQIPDNQKEMISFSMSDPQGVPTKAEGLTKAGFNGIYGSSNSQKTQILMHIESQKGTESKWRFTKTQAIAEPETGSAGYSDVTFPEAYRRFWDDAHGRNSLLSIYAVAIPNLSSISSSTAANNAVIEEGDLTSAASGVWGTDLETEPTHTIQWSVNKSQNATTLYTEDLVYSNNIKHGGSDGLYWYDYTNNTWTPGTATDITKTGATTHGNGRMQFRLSNTSDPTSAGKFDKGHLVFNHALSRITIKLIEGDGFNHSTDKSDFKFDDPTEANRTVNLYKMNYTGTLDLKAGTWSSTSPIPDSSPIRIAPGTHSSTSATSGEPEVTTYTSEYTCTAQILPDYVLNNTSEANVLDFTIDGNTYYIQNKMLWKALHDNYENNGLTDANTYTMAQGKNYVFKITVDKKQVNSVTATIVNWSNVEAANEHINNTHITFNTKLANGTGDQTVTGESAQGFHLFRLAEDLGSINTSSAPDAVKYRGAYIDEAESTYANSKWSTNWYFDDNKTAYHFRAINTLACVGANENTNHNATGSEDHTKQSNFGNTENESIYGGTRNCTYFNMYNGATNAADYHWGAPMVTDATSYYPYSIESGFTSLIHKGITSTESTINITQLHMMSQINVIVRTTENCYGADGNGTAEAASNAIALETGTSGSEVQCDVTITRLYNHGTVDMGTGLISLDKTTSASGITNGIKAEEPTTKPAAGITSNNETGENLVTIDGKKYSTKKTGAYTFNVIPQQLYRGSKTTPEEIAADAESQFVGITIKTPDNNQYYVVKRLSGIQATSVGTSQNQTNGSAITNWYPNHKYTYTFTITKKGIESITCTLANWSDVTGENININLEN